MPKPRLRELRRYRELFDAADSSRTLAELGLVAQQTVDVEHWLLADTLRTKLMDRAATLGVRCKDADECVRRLVSYVRPREMFPNPTDHGATALSQWAVDAVEGGRYHSTYRVESDDGRQLDVELRVFPARRMRVDARSWGPQDPMARWRGRLELEVHVPPDFDPVDLRRAVTQAICPRMERFASTG